MENNKSVLLLLCILFSGGLINLLHAQSKPVPTPEDYEQWETLMGFRLSPDGRWLIYEVDTESGDQELRLRDLTGDSIRVMKNTSRPLFSADSRWLAYYSEGAEGESEEDYYYEEESYEVLLELLDLNTGKIASFQDIDDFSFNEAGDHLALFNFSYGGEGGSLLLVDLESGNRLNFGNIEDYAWAPVGPLLALVIQSSGNNGNGVQLYDIEKGTIKTIENSVNSYSSLTWRKKTDDLAVLRSRSGDDAVADNSYDLVIWNDLLKGSPEKREFRADSTSGFPDTLYISNAQGLRWAEDGSRLYFAVQQLESPEEEEVEEDAPEIEEPQDSTEAIADSLAQDSLSLEVLELEGPESWVDDYDYPSDVQIWHSQDLRIVPRQRAEIYWETDQTMKATWAPAENRFLLIGTDSREDVEVLNSNRHAVETDIKPYPFGTMFGRPFKDIYLIDLLSGERHLIIDSVRHFYGGGPEGNYLLYFKGTDYWTYDIKSGKTENLTQGLDTQFADQEHDHPVVQRPPYGFAGWVHGEAAFVAHDKYDLWKISLSGKKNKRLSQGREEEIVYRYLNLDEEAEFIDLKQPMYCSLLGEQSKKSGFARLDSGKKSTRLIFRDQYLSRLTKAADAEVFVFKAEAFDDPPDLFMGHTDLEASTQITTLNPFHEDFAWGRSALLKYKSTAGQALQAALYYPANYDPEKKYPMIVYTYEKLSQELHHYVIPSEYGSYNFSVYTQEGYFVLAPDIVYRPRDPGISALESVEGAVKAVIEMGVVDPDGIGLAGHSWGGYQATFLPTQTDLFAASVAGAPITNFLSFMGAIHWNPGIPELDHWETGQARMEVPFWEDFDAHVRNSPATFIHQLNTPMLMAFGNSDGVVDWHQGVEFYNFARRAGKKDFVLLVYPGEDHSIAGEVNRLDYNRRIREWFDHYLKGGKAEKWITEGILLKEQEESWDRY